MRNLQLYIQQTYGKDSADLVHEWGDLVKMIGDFQNHRRFMLRCIKAGIIPISCKLRNAIKTPRSIQIIGKAE